MAAMRVAGRTTRDLVGPLKAIRLQNGIEKLPTDTALTHGMSRSVIVGQHPDSLAQTTSVRWVQMIRESLSRGSLALGILGRATTTTTFARGRLLLSILSALFLDAVRSPKARILSPGSIISNEDATLGNGLNGLSDVLVVKVIELRALTT
jgi:hypothetical protein